MRGLRFIPACAGNSRRGNGRIGSRTVHPRVCGEQPANDKVGSSRRGSSPACAGNRSQASLSPSAFPASSPRVRGTGHVPSVYWLAARFIPACAGNRSAEYPVAPAVTVHPRVCGEQRDAEIQGDPLCGSSPRVRGTATKITIKRTSSRFIPACAGNSLCRCSNTCCFSVHPRVCGEQVPFVAVRLSGVRFIPACAGNRVSDNVFFIGTSVHPRVCGEQRLQHDTIPPNRGSSPRVRGTGARRHPSGSSPWFIPACAGNSQSDVRGIVPRSVHPRVCGEQGPTDAVLSGVTGSSPRVRGTGPDTLGGFGQGRFIPACAGNSLRIPEKYPCRAVHPRVCGEQSCRMSIWIGRSGSSPRVRGTVKH